MESPHPDLFLKAARNLGVSPQCRVVLEDSHNGPDLLSAADEVCKLCVAVLTDLHEARLLLQKALG